MGTQGTGRKRSTKKERSTAEDDALNLIAREAEARLAAKRAARAEAREIRMKELERHSLLSVLFSFFPQTLVLLFSLAGHQTLCVPFSAAVTLRFSAHCCCTLHQEIHELKDQIQDVETKYTQNLKEVKDVLVEVEEKYRKAMVSNAQLDNEKNNLMYQVDTLKDSLMELEELLSESRRGYEEKVKEYEREKHAHSVLQFQFSEMKETLKQSEELLNDIRQLRMKQEGFVREISDLQETVEWKDKKIGALERQKEYTDAIRIERDELREEVVQLRDILKVLSLGLHDYGQNDYHDYLWILTRTNFIVKKLKSQLDQKTPKNGTENSSSPDGEILENGNDPNIIELQRDANRQISDFKFKLVKAEQEVTALEQNVTRLEGQVTRYKSAAENAEKVEDELKAEKRKLQRELRSALDKVDELESNNSHLSKRLDKMKTSRGMAQTP
uniref:Leucine rich repeat (in FLII) interacting protein 1a n=1 Tax=Sander lucioperca TaxID=283035 RepID=A0A8C9XJ85_SANLU